MTKSIYYYKNNRRYFRSGYSVIGLKKGTGIYSASTGKYLGFVGQNKTDVFDENEICISC